MSKTFQSIRKIFDFKGSSLRAEDENLTLSPETENKNVTLVAHGQL